MVQHYHCISVQIHTIKKYTEYPLYGDKIRYFLTIFTSWMCEVKILLILAFNAALDGELVNNDNLNKFHFGGVCDPLLHA